MKYGLTEDTIQKIQDVFTTFSQIEKAVIFGSRVKGNYKKGSDIDLTLHGAELTTKLLRKIENKLDDLLLPYKIDLSVFHLISNPDFIEHILRVGQVFYEKRGDFGKDSGDVMKGKVEGWKVKKLEEITTKIGSGATPLGGEKAYKANGVSLIRSLNVHDLSFKKKDLAFLDDKQAGKLSNVVVEAGDVLLNITGASVARCCIVPDDVLPARVNQHVSIIRLIKEEVLPEFLNYMLVSQIYKEKLLKTGEKGGSTRQAITKSEIENFSIAYPSLPEQQRIVSLLDETFAALAQVHANAERNLVNAREVFEAALAKMYENAGEHWEEKNLGDIASEMQTGPFGSTLHKSDYVANGIPVINPQNLVDGKIIPLRKMMVNQKTKERLSRYILQEKDIILARRGEMGRCAIVEKEQAGWLCGSGSFIVRVKKEVDANYLVRYLSSAKVKRILQKGSVGTTMDNLNQGILSQVPVPFPPLEEQRAIVERLDALAGETQRLEAVYQSKLEAVEELRKSVLQKAFEGEL